MQDNIQLSGNQTLILDDAEIQILCDMDSHGGGWTVIQHRTSGNESFQRSWDDYAKGFGDVTKDFWLGNRAIHKLTTNEPMDLMISMSKVRLKGFPFGVPLAHHQPTAICTSIIKEILSPRPTTAKKIV